MNINIKYTYTYRNFFPPKSKGGHGPPGQRVAMSLYIYIYIYIHNWIRMTGIMIKCVCFIPFFSLLLRKKNRWPIWNVLITTYIEPSFLLKKHSLYVLLIMIHNDIWLLSLSFLLIIFKIKKLITTMEYWKKLEENTMFKIYI